MLFELYRLESAFRSFSRPVLHAAARVVQEMGKSRAAAFSLGVYAVDEDTYPEAFLENGSMGLSESTDGEYKDGSMSEGITSFHFTSQMLGQKLIFYYFLNKLNIKLSICNCKQILDGFSVK